MKKLPTEKQLRAEIDAMYRAEPFRMKVEIRHQESRHIAINLYMSIDQKDELINCLEHSGEVPLDLIAALSESIRKKELQTEKDMPHRPEQPPYFYNEKD